MKQTNNAIKFLMAQYRAIFKNAYFKGLTSAVLLTAGLAVAGGAQAVTLTTANLPTDGSTVTVNGTTNTNIRETNVTNATNLNGSLVINSGSASDDSTSGNLLQASASANITGNKFGITIDAKSNDAENVGLAITANSSTSGTEYKVDIGSLTIRKGSLGLAMGTSAQSGDLNVTADTITIGTGTTITGQGNNTAAKIAATVSLGGGAGNGYAAPSGDGTITFGNNATEADAKTVASITTLNKSGIIQFLGADTHADKVIFAGQLIGKGGSLDFSSGDGTIQAYGTDVNANVVVGGGHEAVVDLEDLKRTEGINEGLLQFTSGTINIQGAATGTSGGQLQVTDGTLAIEGNTVITSISTNNDTAGSILVSGTSATDNAILRTSSAQIVSFLNADDHDGKASTANDAEGGVILSGSAAGQSVLEFNDTATVDLYDLVTADPNNTEKLTIKISNTNTAVANTINVSGGTIKATNLAVSDADSTNLNLTKAFLEADNLTLGSADYDDTAADKITVSGSTAHNSLTLLASGDTFTITTGTHTLDAQYYDSQKDKNGNWISNTVAPTHYIKGDDIKLSGAAAVDLKVAGGTWQTSGQDITLAASGSLTVGASGASGSSNVYNNDGNPATLIMDGGQLIIAGTNANGGKVNVTGASGANATLDLTQANKVTFTSGSITVSGSAIGLGSNSTATDKFEDEANASDFYADAFKDKVGYGILKLNQTTFDDYVNQTAGGNGVSLTISGSGIVEVSDLHTQQYDVEKFSGGNTATVGTVLFSGADTYFVVNGDLNLYDGEDSVGSNGEPVIGEASDVQGLNIGSGTIIADRVNLTIYGRQTETDTDGNESTVVSNAVFEQGTVEVSEGFTTNSSTLVLGSGDSAGTNASLVLDAGIGNTGTLMGTGARTINMVGGTTSGGNIEILTGAWGQEQIDISASGSGTGLTVGSADEVLIAQAQALSTDEATVYVAQYTGDNYNGASGSTLTVNEQSLATFNTMQLGDNSTVSVSGHLLINGLNVANPGADTTDPAYVNPNDDDTYTTTAGISFGNANVTVDGPTATLEFGATATSALVNLNGDPDDENSDKSTISLTEGGINTLGDHLTLRNFGHLTLNFAADTKLDADDAKFFTGEFLGGSDETAYLVLNNAYLGIQYENRTDGLNEVKWENLKPFVNIVGSQATTNKLMTALVSHIGAGEAIKGHYGAASVDAASNTDLSLNGPTSFHNAAAFGGNFVTSERDGQVMGVQFTNEYTSLSLENGGTIGSITGSNDYNGDYNSVYITSPNGVLTKVDGSVTEINDFTVDSETEVNGSVAVNYLDLGSTLTTTAQNQGVAVNGGVIRSDAVLTTAQLEIGGANSYTGYVDTLDVLGQVTVTGEDGITLNNGADIAIYGGSISTSNLTISGSNSSHSSVSVSYEPEHGVQDDVTTDYMDESQSYTGYLEVTGTTILNGGVIAVDPEYGQVTAMASLNKLYNAPADANSLVAGTLDGNIFVGQNSALGIGSDSLNTLRAKVAQFQNGQTLVEDQVGAVAYLGKSFTLGAGQGFILTNRTIEEFADHYNRNDGVTADQLNTQNIITSNLFNDTVYLGANTVLMVDAGVMSAADTSRATPTAVITFAGTANGNTNGTGSVIADGGDIVIDGDVRASTYQVFSNATIKYIDGSAYAVVEDSEAANYANNINVSTENDFLQGVVDTNGTNGQVTLGVNPNGRAIMRGASDPVYESLVAYARGYNGPEYKPAAEQTPSEPASETPVVTTPTTPVTDNGIQGVEDSRELYSYNEQGDKVYGQYSNYLLQETISTGDGSAAEAVARLAVYGGAAQAAISAGASTYDAVSGRMGVGVNGANITVADNTQGAALWLAPIYKSSDSDGFDAEGVDYGVDMDLYGVALGADYTLSNGIRFGAMFNVGSGEVDGQGAGSAVSNDFDYYGFAVYGGYSMGALSVVADVSYTVADNDLEGNTSIDKVGASLDSTNLSVGVTGQYQLEFNGTTVTPHAGLRFSRIDLDDYTVDGEDIIADYDADSMNIFSIPVGVTFAKEFTGDAWTVKPSLDLTLTGNFGDDETDGTVHWAGVENLSTNVSSEVLDNFTYGATLGVAAKTGNFSLGLGVNYTGSSNVDEFGVNANARFVF